MTRLSLRTLALAIPLWGVSYAAGASFDQVISESEAATHGLRRAWVAQAEVGNRSRLQNLLLDRGTIFAQTDRAMVQAYDAETGKPLWAATKQIGNPMFPSVPMGANAKLVAVANGTHLYVMNRFTGETLLERHVEGCPGGGLALSDRRVYVPMIDGMVMAFRVKPLTDPLKELGKTKGAKEEVTDVQALQDYRLSQDFIPPLACQSLGRTFVQPLVTRETDEGEFVAWPTDRGLLCVGHIDRIEEDKFTVKYRLETGAEIAITPTYLPPKTVNEPGTIFIASRDGFVHALSDKTGASLWRFPAGGPVVQPLGLIGGNLYVPTQLGGMFCLDAKTGKQKWWAPQIAQFVAASKDRLYGTDKTEQLQVLDLQTGSRIDTIPIAGLSMRLFNQQTDRIYLASPGGLMQCFHEEQLSTPLQYIVEPKKPEKVEKPEKKPLPKAEPGEKKPPAERPAKKPPAEKKAPADKPVKTPKTPKTKAGKKGAAAGDQGGFGADANPFGGAK